MSPMPGTPEWYNIELARKDGAIAAKDAEIEALKTKVAELEAALREAISLADIQLSRVPYSDPRLPDWEVVCPVAASLETSRPNLVKWLKENQ